MAASICLFDPLGLGHAICQGQTQPYPTPPSLPPSLYVRLRRTWMSPTHRVLHGSSAPPIFACGSRREGGEG